MKNILGKILEGHNLSLDEAQAAMTMIMSGKATDAQIAAFLIGMRMKGETVDEITGFALAMRSAATHINIGDIDAVDTCGTGGDTKGTFNVSTVSAVVAAAAGISVAKHGNRSVSSSSGSADVLQELGVNIEAPITAVEKSIADNGIGFLFAPLLHKAMKYAIGPRRELGVRTVFNILGPLTNPAGVKRQLLGLYNADLLEPVAGVLKNLGALHAMVVHSSDGLDEISSFAPTSVAELKNSVIKTYSLKPEDFGMEPGNIDDIKVNNAEESAAIIRKILAAQKCPHRDIVLLNAGAAIYVGGKADTIEKGIHLADEAIQSGKAAEKLRNLCSVNY